MILGGEKSGRREHSQNVIHKKNKKSKRSKKKEEKDKKEEKKEIRRGEGIRGVFPRTLDAPKR